MSGLSHAEHPQPTKLIFEIAKHNIVFFVRKRSDLSFPPLQLGTIVIEVTLQFIEPTCLLLWIYKKNNKSRPLLSKPIIYIIKNLGKVWISSKRYGESGMKIVASLIILFGRSCSDYGIYAVLLLVIGKLSVKSHQRSKLMVHWSDKRPLSSSSDAVSIGKYSVWVEGIPVYKTDMESPLSAQSELKPANNGYSGLTGWSSSFLLLISYWVFLSPYLRRNSLKTLRANLDWT